MYLTGRYSLWSMYLNGLRTGYDVDDFIPFDVKICLRLLLGNWNVTVFLGHSLLLLLLGCTIIIFWTLFLAAK